MTDARNLHPDTLALAGGYDPADAFGAVKPPVMLTSTFAYPSAQAAKDAHRIFFESARPDDAGFIYARLDHPNLRILQTRFAALDGAEDCAAFSSGMAAMSAIMLATVRSGDTVLHTAPLYGGTLGLLNGLLRDLGVTPIAIADALDPASVAAAADAATGPIAAILVETPANPTAGIADIAAARSVADRLGTGGRRPLVVVDNTFLGPLLQHPLQHGADLAMTSLTKYAGGHSDLLAGAVTGSHDKVLPVRKLRTTLGTHLDPFTAWLATRSLETLPLRSARANNSAAKVAAWLAAHDKVETVTYLGLLPDGPAKTLYERQCLGAGSTFSFVIRGGEREAFAMLDRLALMRMAVSLGGTETLICHSATTTHYSVAPEVRARDGVTAGSMRISIGLEHPDDLIADLAHALEAV